MHIDVDVAVDRRERALRAGLARTDPAACADGCGGVEVGEIETVGVDGALGMTRLAAQPDSKNLAWLAKTRRVMLDRARDPHIRPTIRHQRELTHDLARVGKRLVDIPQRARTAGMREVEARGGLAFGHVAGAVDTHERPRNPAQAGTLHRGKPVADRLVAHAIRARE